MKLFIYYFNLFEKYNPHNPSTTLDPLKTNKKPRILHSLNQKKLSKDNYL